MGKSKEIAQLPKYYLLVCLAAALIAGGCLRYFILRYAAAKRKTVEHNARLVSVNGLFSSKQALGAVLRNTGIKLEMFPLGDGGISQFILSASAEINRLAAESGVRLNSLRVINADSAELEIEVSGLQQAQRMFINSLERSLFLFSISKLEVSLSGSRSSGLKTIISLRALKNLQESLLPKGGYRKSQQIFISGSKSKYLAGDFRLFSGEAGRSGEERDSLSLSDGGRAEIAGFQLTGVILGERPVAVLFDRATGRNYRLNVGQAINGLRIENISKGRVVLRSGERSYELSL